MAKRLNTKRIERCLNAISTKYRFQDQFELEQEDFIQFCRDFQQAEALGLRVDKDDSEFIDRVLELYTSEG